MTKIAIIGAAGRMSRRIAALAIESGEFQVVAATEHSDSPEIGSQAAGVTITENLEGAPDVVIDFSLPEGTMKVLPVCREGKIPMIIGTTGLTESQLAEIADSAGEIPIVHASNYSMGINLLCRLVEQAAKTLGGEYDIEISETHHRFKQDAPSGTAIMLADSACRGLSKDLSGAAIHGRSGKQPREQGEIGIHAVRLGDTVGEHSVHFGNLGETVTLGHSAHTRDTFVRGALRAAVWVTGKGPGLYSMQDVLGL